MADGTQALTLTRAEFKTQFMAALEQVKDSKSLSEQTPSPYLQDIARDEKGNVLLKNHYDAEKYCKEKGSRLPTVRELAMESQRLGAKGIDRRG